MKKFLIILLAVCLAGGIGFDAQARKSTKKNRTTTSATSATKINQVKANLVGTYLAQFGGYPSSEVKEMQRQYNKYVITTTDFSSYSWEDGKGWVFEYKVPYTIKYYANNHYMTGYCIVFDAPSAHGGHTEMCTGDLDYDGRMDIWMSDCIYWSKQ